MKLATLKGATDIDTQFALRIRAYVLAELHSQERPHIHIEHLASVPSAAFWLSFKRHAKVVAKLEPKTHATLL